MTQAEAYVAALNVDTKFLAQTGAEPKQGNGWTTSHLRWMVQEMHLMSENKTMRWLGYIQGVLVAQGYASLEEMKEINREATSA